MRYDKKIVFVIETGGEYDPELGEHIEPAIVKTEKMANITDLGTERSKVLFGDVKQGAKVVRLLRPYLKKWDYALIGNDKYKIVTGRQLRLKNTFILQEVNQ